MRKFEMMLRHKAEHLAGLNVISRYGLIDLLLYSLLILRAVITKGLLIVPLMHLYIVCTPSLFIVRLFIGKVSGPKVFHGLLQLGHRLLILLKIDDEVCCPLPLENAAAEIFNVLSSWLLLVD